MLTSLGIKNYRNLKNLEIEKLARVNLIAGKNNTGKTSLLEAILLYAAKGSLGWLNILLGNRGEYYNSGNTGATAKTLENNIKSYRSLFYERSFNEFTHIVIGPLQPKDPSDLIISFERIEAIDDLPELTSIPAITIKLDKRKNKSYPMHSDILTRELAIADPLESSHLHKSNNSTSNFQLVATSGNLRLNNDQLWSNVALKDEEEYVIKALKIIEPRIDGIAFISIDGRNERTAVAKLKGINNPEPLQSMGDGMNRILTIVLALVNSENGYLLIDEFENGLHYTVQEDLWRMIFKLAKELNVQVFATTHSNDCIRAFENVLNNGNQSEGQYFRLEKFGDIIKPIFYSPDELEVATDQNIETR